MRRLLLCVSFVLLLLIVGSTSNEIASDRVRVDRVVLEGAEDGVQPAETVRVIVELVGPKDKEWDARFWGEVPRAFESISVKSGGVPTYAENGLFLVDLETPAAGSGRSRLEFELRARSSFASGAGGEFDTAVQRSEVVSGYVMTGALRTDTLVEWVDLNLGSFHVFDVESVAEALLRLDRELRENPAPMGRAP